MFGLKYILETYHMSNADLANKLQINRANISMWLKNKEIPAVRIQDLKKIFPQIPEPLFNKELKKSEQLSIQQIYFTVTDQFESVQSLHIDSETGEEIWFTETVSENEGFIRFLEHEHEKVSLLEKYETLIEENNMGNSRINLLEEFAAIVQQNESRSLELLDMVFYYLNDKHKSDFDSVFWNVGEESETYKEFYAFLEKHKFRG
ncbi:helix-turn-helix transcriptional regulator [Paenibacillus sp. FJAT-26967]|uniref:helix-turn-helix domain-containing protein n=1 Tax=Paenibacillus sp. FJAT-26967 TaxID=1729690 RepID=UPI000838A418|nr:helix-turn-helix transcriptional regulator [Paenibacillus sp. FJAT-26967]